MTPKTFIQNFSRFDTFYPRWEEKTSTWSQRGCSTTERRSQDLSWDFVSCGEFRGTNDNLSRDLREVFISNFSLQHDAGFADKARNVQLQANGVNKILFARSSIVEINLWAEFHSQ